MPYSQYTLDSLTAEISLALQDSANVFWKVPEIQSAIKEGLLYWGALTSYWRQRGAFTSIAGTPFYDLSAIFPDLRARTTTLGDLLTQIQYHLDEPPSGIAGTGMTSQFTIGQLTQALVLKRNEFVLDSRLPFSWTNPPLAITPPQDGRTDLPSNVVAIGHAAWIDGQNVSTPLRREDAWSEDSLNPTWTINPTTPFAYSEAETRPIQLQFYPPPLSSGMLELLYVQSIQMPGQADTELFLVPDEFASAIKWGSLYSILSTHNEGYDPNRAQYALERYTQLVKIAADHRSIARVQINGIPVPLDTIWNLDAVFSSWRNRSGQPSFAATIFDLLALAKVPNNAYGIAVDLVRSAPLPAIGNDTIQLGPEDIPYLIDYVRHILSFKLGGDEFAATMPLYDNFLKAATQRNSLLSTKARYLTPLFGQAANQEAIFHAA